MCHRAALFFLAILSFLTATSIALAGSNHQSESGYFRISEDWEGEALVLHAEPSATSRAIKPLRVGDIVASAGITRWGGPSVWQQITSDLTEGWVPKRILMPILPATIEGTVTPSAGSCWGSVPTWSMSWNRSALHVWLFPGDQNFDLSSVEAKSNNQTSLLIAQSGNGSFEFIHTGEACAPVEGNGRSGRTGILILRSGSNVRFLTGCCQADASAFAR